MKRLFALAMTAVLALGASTQAFAAASDLEVKAKGSWRFEFGLHSNNGQFLDNLGTDDFDVRQRLRTTFRFVYNKNVMGEIQMELGDTFWGDARTGGELDTRQRMFELKRGYIQFTVPDTNILTSVGLQSLTLPNSGYFGSMILDADAGALLTTVPVNDMVSVLLGYSRLGYTRSGSGVGLGQGGDNEFDAILGAAPITLDGFKITPFFTVAWLGKDIQSTGDNGTQSHDINPGEVFTQFAALRDQGLLTKSTNPWWIGLAYSMDFFDPFVFNADFNYGQIDDMAKLGGNDVSMSGWLIDAALTYKGFKGVTPELFFAYSSGVNANDATNKGDLNVMPWIGQTFSVPGTMLGGSYSAQGDDASTIPGFWMIGAAFRDISFVEKLSHELLFLYGKGTNDANIYSNATTSSLYSDLYSHGGGNVFYAHPFGFLTDKDSYWEVDFNHKYQLYESLALMLELGYGKPELDSQTKAAQAGNFGDAGLYKGTFIVKYDF